jgi:hypothetical protein
MSTYYKEKIQYITEDLMQEGFDLQSAFNKIKDILQDESHPFYWKKIYRLKVKLQIHSPDYDLLDRFYHEGVYKSHEYEAIVDSVKAKIKSNITILTDT